MVELTDAELQAWHASCTELRNYQTLCAHIRASGAKAEKNEPKRDVSEYE